MAKKSFGDWIMDGASGNANGSSTASSAAATQSNKPSTNNTSGNKLSFGEWISAGMPQTPTASPSTSMSGNSYSQALGQYTPQTYPGANGPDFVRSTGKTPSISATKVTKRELDEYSPVIYGLAYGDFTAEEYTDLQAKQRDAAQKNLDALYDKNRDFWTAEDYANQKTYKQQIEDYTKSYNDALSGAAFLDDTQKARVAQLEKEQEAALRQLQRIESEAGWALTVELEQDYRKRRNAQLEKLNSIRAEIDSLDPSKLDFTAQERISGTAKGSSRQWAGSQVAALGTAVTVGNALQEASSEEDRQIADSMYAGWVTDDLSRQNFLDAGVQGDGVLAENKRVETSLQKRADEMLERSNKELEDAKRNLGRGGQIALDVLAQGIQMGLDAATRAGSVSMWTRSFGSASQEARLQGAGVGQQFLYGAAVATVETLTEKIADGAAGIYGKGSADILADDIIFKLASTTRGQNALRFIYRAVSEGGEEVLSGLMEPVLKAIYDGGEAFKNAHMTTEGKQEYLSELGYSALIGAILGGAGGSVSLATGQDAMSNVSAQARAEITQMISSGNINEAQATRIASNPILSEAFEEVTGITLAVDRTAETNLAGNTVKGKDGKAVPSDQKAILETRVKQIMSAKPQASQGAQSAQQAQGDVPVAPATPNASTSQTGELNSTPEAAPSPQAEAGGGSTPATLQTDSKADKVEATEDPVELLTGIPAPKQTSSTRGQFSVEETVIGDQLNDRAEADIISGTNSPKNANAKTNAEDRLSALKDSSRYTFETKPAIKASKKDYAKVSDSRVELYRGLGDADVPAMDIVDIAEYGEVNVGYSYVIRNSGRDGFEIVAKIKIGNAKYFKEANADGRTDTRNNIRISEGVETDNSSAEGKPNAVDSRAAFKGRDGADVSEMDKTGERPEVGGYSAGSAQSVGQSVNDSDIGKNVKQMPAPNANELSFAPKTERKTPKQYKEAAEKKALNETEAKAENAKSISGHNVKEMEAPAPEYAKATIAKKNFGSHVQQVSDTAKSLSYEVNEMAAALKDKNRKELTSEEKTELDVARRLEGLAQQIERVANGEQEMSAFESYYSKLKNSKNANVRRLYFTDVAEHLELACALLYGEETDSERGTRVAYEAIEMLNHRVHQRAEADYTIFNVTSNIGERTRRLRSSLVYRTFLKGGKKTGRSLTQDLISPRLLFKMLDGCSAHNRWIGYSLSDEEMSCNENNKIFELEANNFFNDFFEHEESADFLNGKLLSNINLSALGAGKYKLSAIELLSIVRSYRSAMESRGDGEGSRPEGFVIMRDGEKIAVDMEEGRFEVFEKAFDKMLEENEAVRLYNSALDNLFKYFGPKMNDAFKGRNGYDLVLLGDKYYPVRYATKENLSLREERSFFEVLGSVKERTRESGGLLFIEPDGDAVQRYIQNAAQYSAWAEFSKKIQTLAESDMRGDSLITAFKNAYGEGISEQFKSYVEALQFKTKTSKNTFIESAAQILRKNLGQSAIVLKVSTPIKQAAGTLAAGGEINIKYLFAAQFGIGKKYSGVDNKLLQHRALGAIDPTIENININGDIWWQKAISKIPGGKAWLKAVPAADKAAIKNIYKAAAMQVAAEHDVKDISDPKIKEEVDKLFARALLGTQSDATQISNSKLYRSDSELVKNLTLFTSQSNAQFNAAITAAMEAAAAKGTSAYKSAAKKRNAVYFAQIASSVEFALLGQVVRLVLHKRKKDEEEGILPILAEIGDDALETLAGIHLLGDTVYSVAKFGIQLLSGKDTETLYDISTGGLSTITDLIEKLNRFGQNVTLKNAKDLALSFSNLAGIPMSGAYDLVNAIALWSRDAYRAISGDEFDGDKYSDVMMFLQNKLDTEKRLTGLGFGERIIYNASKEREASYDAMRALAEATGNMSFLPSEPDSGLTIDGTDYKLTEKQKDKFHDTQVDAYYGIMDDLINKAIYKNADVETQAAMADAAKKYAYDIAKAEYAKEAHVEYESEYETLRDGIDVPGVDDEGNPKPDIPGLSEKEIQKYLVYKAAYNKETADKDYKALDALLAQYETSLTSKAQQHFERENSAVIEAYEAGVGTRSYYTYLEEKKKQAKNLDVTTGSSDAIFHGLVNASIPQKTKDILADLVIESQNIKAMYHAASDGGYDVKTLPDLWKEILASDPDPEVSDTSLSGGDLAYACRNNPGLEYIFKAIYDVNKRSPNNPDGWKSTWEQIKKLK